MVISAKVLGKFTGKIEKQWRQSQSVISCGAGSDSLGHYGERSKALPLEYARVKERNSTLLVGEHFVRHQKHTTGVQC